MKRYGASIFIALAAALAAGCKPRDSMGTQPNYKPQEPAAFFNDYTSQRPLMTGVVPRPVEQSPGLPYVAVKAHGPVDLPTTIPSTIPYAITRAMLERGQERFDIYCAPCHGRYGDGDGMIAQRGFPRPPSFYIPRLAHASDGYFYQVITHGHGAMFSYADRVAPDDRWAIVSYVRALQAGHGGPRPTTEEAMR